MAEIGATEFKARCLELMDRVAERRETFVITKRGRAVARLVPVEPAKARDIFGCMADRTELVGDVTKPLFTDDEWAALAGERLARFRAGPPGKRGRRRR